MREIIIQVDETHYSPPAPADVPHLRKWIGDNVTVLCFMGGHEPECAGVVAVARQRPCLCPCHKELMWVPTT